MKEELPEWPWRYAWVASEEGWGLDGAYQIVRDENAQIFQDNRAAFEHVKKAAATGSGLHRTALAIHARFARGKARLH